MGRTRTGSMNREHRKQLAEDTLRIIASGRYTPPRGETIDISAAIAACRSDTRLYTPERLQTLCEAAREPVPASAIARVEVVNETTLQGIAALVTDHGGESVAALNFASAKNPGGGFLGGAQAQEESLARSSALYASQLDAPAFYERHRRSPSLLYSDAMILSPGCPVFRDDEGALLRRPQRVAFITAAAPNAGAIRNQRPAEVGAIESTLKRRAACVLALAAERGFRHLVLGAWGCGVFRNDPARVAATFADLLRDPAWSSRFDRVRFSVLDSSVPKLTFRAFETALRGIA